MGYFSKPHWQNPKHFAENVHKQEPWKPQNPKHTLQGMNNVIGDQNAGDRQGFSPEMQAIADANAASGNVGTPGRRPGMIFDKASNSYKPDPNYQKYQPGQIQSATPRNEGRPAPDFHIQPYPYPERDPNVMPPGMNMPPRTYPSPIIGQPSMGTPGRRNAGTGSPGMRPKGDGRDRANANRVNQVFGMLR